MAKVCCLLAFQLGDAGLVGLHCHLSLVVLSSRIFAWCLPKQDSPMRETICVSQDKQGKEQTTPFEVNLMRSQVLPGCPGHL